MPERTPLSVIGTAIENVKRARVKIKNPNALEHLEVAACVLNSAEQEVMKNGV